MLKCKRKRCARSEQCDENYVKMKKQLTSIILDLSEMKQLSSVFNANNIRETNLINMLRDLDSSGHSMEFSNSTSQIYLYGQFLPYAPRYSPWIWN